MLYSLKVIGLICLASSCLNRRVDIILNIMCKQIDEAQIWRGSGEDQAYQSEIRANEYDLAGGCHTLIM
jgi:hypothetical protein